MGEGGGGGGGGGPWTYFEENPPLVSVFPHEE